MGLITPLLLFCRRAAAAAAAAAAASASHEINPLEAVEHLSENGSMLEQKLAPAIHLNFQ